MLYVAGYFSDTLAVVDLLASLDAPLPAIPLDLHDGRYATIRELTVAGKHGQGDGRTTDLAGCRISRGVSFQLANWATEVE